MTSDHELAAIRRNATRSTGPRSAAGKIRSSRNALRHGLAISLGRYSAESAEIDRLARTIVDDKEDSAALYYARIAATAELEIQRVRVARVALVNQMVSDRKTFEPETSADLELLQPFLHPTAKRVAAYEKNCQFLPPPIPEDPERIIVAFRRAVPDLAKYDRYERRALSRRKRALRALDAMRSEPAVGPTG